MRKFIIILFIAGNSLASAQFNGKVGINTTAPTETLDVNGVAHADLLYMRSPGEPQEVPLYFMASADTKLSVFNHNTATSSLINLIDLHFKRVNNTGVVSYNTKIDAVQFIMAVRSFSLEKYNSTDPNPATADLNVFTVHAGSPNSNNSTNTYYQGSPNFVSYIAPTNPADPNSQKTWWIRANYMNSSFTDADGAVEATDRFNIRLQILVYRKLITKAIDTVQYFDLNGQNGSSATLPKPGGF